MTLRAIGSFYASACFIAVAVPAACSSPDGAPPPPDGKYATAEQAGTGALSWKGYDWNVTTGGMAGVAQGDPSNVTVDPSGYLHLKLTKTAATWTAAELVSTTNLGFGTYQWQIAGPIDRMDHNVVLGLAPYGPAAGVGTDGYNEIDTEFSYWNDELGHVNMDWGVYPATKAGAHQETDFFFSLSGGNETTARMVWSKTGVVSTVFSGFVPLGSNANQLNTNTYAPPNPNDNIPQQALPVLLNLWCYKAVPATGTVVEVVLQDFQFIPEGQPIPMADASTDPVDAEAADAGGPGQGDGGEGGSGAADDAGEGGSGSGSGGGSGSGSGGSGSGAAGGTGSDAGGASAVGSDGGCSVGAAWRPRDRSTLTLAICGLVALAIGAARRRGSKVT
jgi:hypothetical protein